MKRQIMKSLLALCAGVMTLCAASSLFTSCDKYDDSALREQIENLDNRVKAIENLKEQLTALSQKVDAALYTIEFDVNAENHLLYSLDGGKTWIDTEIVLAEECTCEPPQPCTCVPCDNPRITVVDNEDGSVTYTIGDHSFTVEVPEEIVFELRAGKVYFASEATQAVNIKSSGIEDISVLSTPKGWYADINAEGKLEVTAPNVEETFASWDEEFNEIPAKASPSGYVKVHACSAEGKCMVGKLPVEVTNSPITVRAYAGKFVVVVTGWSDVYYGISTKDTYLDDAQKVIDTYNKRDWNNLPETFTDETIEGNIADILGYEPKVGEEYVVWAFDSYADPLTIDQLVLTYYSPVNVVVTEEKAKKTAYDVFASVEVFGADEYYAYCIPGAQVDADYPIEYFKESFAMEAPAGGYWAPGKLYNKSYNGSVYSIADGTMSSATGMGSPGAKCYLLILPIDGRPVDEYTAADVKDYEFTTSELTSGLATTVTATQCKSYVEYGYEMVLDDYTELGAQIDAPADGAVWDYLYYMWMTEEELSVAAGDDDLLVNLVVSDVYVEIERPGEHEFPLYSTTKVESGASKTFVAFYTDAAGKYGPVTKLALTSKVLQTSDIEISGATSNLVDEVNLSNTTTLELVLETTATASKFKYLLTDISDYNSMEGLTDAELANRVTFDKSRAVEVENVDGKISIPGHEYKKSYHLAILPYDEAGNPGKKAYVLLYDCNLVIEKIYAEDAATAPQVDVVVTEKDTYSTVEVTVTPKAGTEAAMLLLDTKNLVAYYEYDLAALTPEVKAVDLWTKTGPNNTDYIYYVQFGNAETPITSTRNFYKSSNPEPLVILSWVADGKYYYKEINPFGPAAPAEPTAVTVAEFLAAEVGDTWYKLTGIIENVASTTYGNFDLKDETGTVYVYGLTATQVESNDRSFASLNLRAGDEVTLIGKRAIYTNKEGVTTDQVGGAYYVSHVDNTPDVAVEDLTNVTVTPGEKYFSEEANINDVLTAVHKLGTSSANGSMTVTLPAGTKKVTYNAVGWKNKTTALNLTLGIFPAMPQAINANDGATNNSPYTIVATDADKYEVDLEELDIELTADTEVKIESVGRAIIWNIVAE